VIDIERAVCDWLTSEIPALKFALDYEPSSLSRMPGTTLLARQYNPVQAETGVGEDVTYAWRLRLYVPLNDYRQAQSAIKELMPQILACVRHHPTADGLVDFLSIVDEGEEPEFNVEEGWLAKDVILRAIRDES
jgi:hypothetical protein